MARPVARRRATSADGLPQWIRPQLTQLVDEAPDGPEWLHEIKFDGYRMHARLDRGNVRLLVVDQIRVILGPDGPLLLMPDRWWWRPKKWQPVVYFENREALRALSSETVTALMATYPEDFEGLDALTPQVVLNPVEGKS
jgi:hypothetical protein